MPLIRADLALKHQAMSESAFRFLRATFYRWAQTFPRVCADLMDAPQPLAIGDLHVENFGTWRDIEGRLIWGINDFDEACRLPYTVDLVRLATSAHLAIDGEHLRLSKAQASKAILDGYIAALKAGGKAFVLAEHHAALRHAAVERLKEPEKFWQKLSSFREITHTPPSAALKGLRRMLPEEGLECRLCHRIAGTGSLGRRRYVALTQWRGASIAREAKELGDSAWKWDESPRYVGKIFYGKILDRAIRVPDPFVRLRGRWIVRRLAPDCSRIELSSLPEQHDAVRLVHAMGWETANIHLGSFTPAILLRDIARRPANWLHAAAQDMVESTLEDWRDWRRIGKSKATFPTNERK
ncbi:MAG TPA: DUF2252 family protein [Bryobacteraceae bacterium]